MSRPRSGGCATPSRRCSRRSTSWSTRASRARAGRASRRSSRPIACSPTDRGWLARMTEAVRSGLTAEAAVQKVRDETKSRMMQVTDPYLRERLYDLEDLANRLQQFLIRAAADRQRGRVPTEFILVAAGDGAGRAAGLRASPDQGARARGRLADRCMSRSSRARSTFRSSAGSPTRPASDRAGRRRRRRRRPRQRADPSARRHPADRSRQRSPRARGAAPITRPCATSRP